MFYLFSDPNVGITKLPVVVEKVDDLPKWPKFTNASREFLDMESLSRMLVGKRLREKYCSFLDDPEGFIENEDKVSTKPTSTTTQFNKPSSKCSSYTTANQVTLFLVLSLTLMNVIF